MGISIVDAERDCDKIQISMEMLDHVRKQIYIYMIGYEFFSVGLEQIKIDMERDRNEYTRQSRTRIGDVKEYHINCSDILEDIIQKEKIYETMQNSAKDINDLRNVALNEMQNRCLQQQRISSVCALSGK